MSLLMEFPKTPEEFINEYKFVDKQSVYTNCEELIPVFRVKQMMRYYFTNKKGE